MGYLINWYGLIVGTAVLLVWQLALWQAKKRQLSVIELEKIGFWILIGGLFGARLYHVITDYHLYLDSWWTAFYIWQGGLSIIGAVGGGLVAAKLWHVTKKPSFSMLSLLDLVALVLPFGQAIGRWGNYVNQELYGAPTNLPWALTIRPEHRMAGFEQYAMYHPLFLYESLALLMFGLWLWWYQGKHKQIFGTGIFFAWYVVFYATVRYCLDFLRLDKPIWFGLSLSINQLVMIGIFCVAGFWLWQKRQRWWMVLVGVMVAATFWQHSLLPSANNQVSAWIALQAVPDHSLVQIGLGNQQLSVEVVNTPDSITQGLSDRAEIGADGMLFVLPQPTKAIFWMKDMQFNLDLVWIASDQVVGVTTHVPAPHPDTALKDLVRYGAPAQVQLVLELEAGQSELKNIEIGDQIQFLGMAKDVDIK